MAAGPDTGGKFCLLHIKTEYVFILQGKGSRTSMFVQSLRSDPYRVSFIIVLFSRLFLYNPLAYYLSFRCLEWRYWTMWLSCVTSMQGLLLRSGCSHSPYDHQPYHLLIFVIFAFPLCSSTILNISRTFFVISQKFPYLGFLWWFFFSGFQHEYIGSIFASRI